MSTSSGDAADEVVRMMLSGAEMTLRLTASATKNLLALSVALTKSRKKLYGRTNMKKMLRETRDIRVFPMTREQLQQFEKQAKKYGLLYASIRDKDPNGKLVDLVLPATELSRANTVFEKIRYGQEQQAEPPETAKENDSKNVSRSGPGSRDTRSRASSSGRDVSRQMTSERTSVEARLETYRVQLTQKRVPARQRRAMQKKRMAHKQQARQ